MPFHPSLTHHRLFVTWWKEWKDGKSQEGHLAGALGSLVASLSILGREEVTRDLMLQKHITPHEINLEELHHRDSRSLRQEQDHLVYKSGYLCI